MFNAFRVIFETQAKLMRVLRVDERRGDMLSPNEGFSPAEMEALIGLSTEASEALAETMNATKPWKHFPHQVLVDRIKEELADCLFFLVEAFILLGGADDELFYQFIRKQLIVRARVIDTALRDRKISPIDIRRMVLTGSYIGKEEATVFDAVTQSIKIFPLIEVKITTYANEPIEFIKGSFDYENFKRYVEGLQSRPGM